MIVDAIAFNIDTKSWPDNGVSYVKIVYTLDVNDYRGLRNVQLVVKYLEPASEADSVGSE